MCEGKRKVPLFFSEKISPAKINCRLEIGSVGIAETGQPIVIRSSEVGFEDYTTANGSFLN